MRKRLVSLAILAALIVVSLVLPLQVNAASETSVWAADMQGAVSNTDANCHTNGGDYNFHRRDDSGTTGGIRLQSCRDEMTGWAYGDFSVDPNETYDAYVEARSSTDKPARMGMSLCTGNSGNCSGQDDVYVATSGWTSYKVGTVSGTSWARIQVRSLIVRDDRDGCPGNIPCHCNSSLRVRRVYLVGPGATPPPPPPPPPPPWPAADIQFWVDNDYVQAGTCTWVRWHIQYVKAYWVDGTPGAGDDGSMQVCPCADETHTLHVLLPDDSTRDLSVTVRVWGSCTPPPPWQYKQGLKAQYYHDDPPGGDRFDGAQGMVNYETVNIDTAGAPNPSVNGDFFAVRWEGDVYIGAAGLWTFATRSDDGVRVWVDINNDEVFDSNELIIDNWTDHPPTWNLSPILNLNPGWYRIKVEYYEATGGATCQLYYTGPGVGWQIIPIWMLRSF